MAMLAVVLWATCGGGGGQVSTLANAETPAGTYPLTVMGTYTSGTSTAQNSVKLTLTVN